MGRIIAITPLSNVATISSGQQLNRSTLQSTGRYPVYNGGTTTSGYTDKFNTPADQIIISQGGESAGFVNYITTPFWAGAHCYVIQPQTRSVDKRYLYFYLKSMQSYLQGSRTGSSIPGLSKSRLSSFPVQIPSIAEQQTISNVLTSIEDAISLNNSSIKTCSEIIQLVYDYWFVQFDFPDEDGRPYKSSGGKMVYSEQLGQEIPDGWEAVKFSSIAKIISGFPFKSDDYTGNGKYKIITIKNVQDSNIDSSSANSIDTLPDNLPNNCKLHVGDLLISLTGNVGRCGQVFEDNLLLNQRVGKLMVRNKVNENFAISTISSLQQQKRMEQLSNGSSQANLSPVQAVDFYIALPPSELLAKFNDIARPARKLSLSLQQESKLLASLRDWLLPMLMTGQVAIMEADDNNESKCDK